MFSFDRMHARIPEENMLSAQHMQKGKKWKAFLEHANITCFCYGVCMGLDDVTRLSKKTYIMLKTALAG